MSRPAIEIETARELAALGLSNSRVARALGVPRETVRDWRRRHFRRGGGVDPTCPRCGHGRLDSASYAYLLGLYLGDGCLSEHRRGVYRLRISLDATQPAIIDECTRAVEIACAGRRVRCQPAKGCIEVGAYWKHWPCLFPQHGRGRKHRRPIALVEWQAQITSRYPDRLLRGLIHSDGCRVKNRVGKRAYPRYYFSNRSEDIHGIFRQACLALGLTSTRSSGRQQSVARAGDVAKLDLLVGDKG